MNLSMAGAVLTALWLLAAILIPDRIPMEKWRIPESMRWAVVGLAVVFAPAVWMFIWISGGCTVLINYKSMLEERKRLKRLNELKFENSRGLFDVDSNNDTDSILKIKEILITAIERNGSDIFIDPLPDGGSTVRIRANGSLFQIDELPSDLAKSVTSAIKVVAHMDISEHRQGQDGAFSINFEGRAISFRVASVGAYSGEKLSLRILGSASGVRNLNDLGLDAGELGLLKKAVGLPSGLVLMCGPTGSGKTSTLYAMLQNVDFSLKNVISIEDPIENIIPNVSQIEVNNKAGVTFASVLRNSLRQNPDILCVGEIRDAETAGIAVQAAQTGHLIIATVHSNDNLGTIDRLQNLGVPLRTVAATLHIIVSQRLVRTLCPHCKVPAQLPPEYVEYFNSVGLPLNNIFVSQGCPECNNTGYIGRKAVFDILVLDAEMREMLEDEHTTMASVQAFLEERFGTNVLAYKALELVSRGITSLDEANRVTFDLG
ncbi:MAG: type II/IV secretion system protein [Lentisphaeria bacterium]|nr:type II/IV secretion system protein [Lentisphaeria bacterium]